MTVNINYVDVVKHCKHLKNDIFISSCCADIVAEMESDQENTTTHQNQSDFWNDTAEGIKQPSDHAATNISLGVGSCITLINVTVMFFLLRHRKSIDGTGFWQQLVFLCFTDILTGLTVCLPPFGYLFFDIHPDIIHFVFQESSLFRYHTRCH